MRKLSSLLVSLVLFVMPVFAQNIIKNPVIQGTSGNITNGSVLSVASGGNLTAGAGATVNFTGATLIGFGGGGGGSGTVINLNPGSTGLTTSGNNTATVTLGGNVNVSSGGTGLTTVAAGNLLSGNTTGALIPVAFNATTINTNLAATYQPLSANLTALSAFLPGNSTVFVRFPNGTVGAAAIGANLSLNSTTLDSTGGGGGGSVTSVAMSVPAFLSIAGSPITTSGTLAITLSGTALPVANGGTGDVTLTGNSVMVGNGTGAVKFIGPTASALAGWNGTSVPAAITFGANLTLTGNVLDSTGGGTTPFATSSLTAQSILVGNTTNLVRQIGPVNNSLAGWNGTGNATALAIGGNLAITNGTIDAAPSGVVSPIANNHQLFVLGTSISSGLYSGSLASVTITYGGGAGAALDDNLTATISAPDATGGSAYQPKIQAIAKAHQVGGTLAQSGLTILNFGAGYISNATVTFTDSSSAGTVPTGTVQINSDAYNSWPAQLSRFADFTSRNITVQNFAVAGRYAYQYPSDYDTNVHPIAHAGDWLVLEPGPNDYAARVEGSFYLTFITDNLEATIKKALADGLTVVICTIPPDEYAAESYPNNAERMEKSRLDENNAILALAAFYKIRVARPDLQLTDFNDLRRFNADKIHLNVYGQYLFAQEVQHTLQSYGTGPFSEESRSVNTLTPGTTATSYLTMSTGQGMQYLNHPITIRNYTYSNGTYSNATNVVSLIDNLTILTGDIPIFALNTTGASDQYVPTYNSGNSTVTWKATGGGGGSLPTISGGTAGKILTNDGSAASWATNATVILGTNSSARLGIGAVTGTFPSDTRLWLRSSGVPIIIEETQNYDPGAIIFREYVGGNPALHDIIVGDIAGGWMPGGQLNGQIAGWGVYDNDGSQIPQWAFDRYKHQMWNTRTQIGSADFSFVGNMAVNGTVNATGNMNAPAFNVVSDESYKTAAHLFKVSAEDFEKLRPLLYHFTPEFLAAHPSLADKEYAGMFAQEVGAVFPWAAERGTDGKWTINYAAVTAGLIAADQDIYRRQQVTNAWLIGIGLVSLLALFESQRRLHIRTKHLPS